MDLSQNLSTLLWTNTFRVGVKKRDTFGMHSLQGEFSRSRLLAAIARCYWIFMFHLSLRTINRCNEILTRNNRLKRDNDWRCDYSNTENRSTGTFAHNRAELIYRWWSNTCVHDFTWKKSDTLSTKFLWNDLFVLSTSHPALIHRSPNVLIFFGNFFDLG